MQLSIGTLTQTLSTSPETSEQLTIAPEDIPTVVQALFLGMEGRLFADVNIEVAAGALQPSS